ncbi:MAG: NAD(P)H-dependent oxidoreductase [Myxococcota bacterium]
MTTPTPARGAAHRVLVLFAHPAVHKSRANQRLISGVRELDGVTFHDLYDAYPDLCIDVDAEQELLCAHDIVVMQFPLFWYSTPAILKEWQDLVLQHGWAYGHDGDALVGKSLVVAVTTGGAAHSYNAEGYNRFTLKELLTPLQATAHMCEMKFAEPFVVYDSHRASDEELSAYATKYKRLLLELRDGA